MGAKSNPRRHPQVAAAVTCLKAIDGVTDVEFSARRGAKYVIFWSFRGRHMALTAGCGKEERQSIRHRIKSQFRAAGIEVRA